MRCFSIPPAMKGTFKIKSASIRFANFLPINCTWLLKPSKKVVISYQQKLPHWILYSIRVFHQPSTDDFGYRVGLITLDIPSVVHYILTCQDFLAVGDFSSRQRHRITKATLIVLESRFMVPTLILSYTPIAYIYTSNTFPSPIPPFQETL